MIAMIRLIEAYQGRLVTCTGESAPATLDAPGRAIR
jgi:hypothetical protein